MTFKELLNWLNVPKNPKEETFSEVIGESGLSSLRGICHTQDENGVRKLQKSTVLDVIQNFDFSDEIGHQGTLGDFTFYCPTKQFNMWCRNLSRAFIGSDIDAIDEWPIAMRSFRRSRSTLLLRFHTPQ